MKVGIIGIGDIARKAYLPVLTQIKGIELHVCTRNADVLQEVAATYRIKYTYQNIDDWLTSGIKAAFVHAATDSHEVIIDQLLDHGIHVYVDKPITYDFESSKRLIDKAKSNRLLLMVGFNRRYAPPYQKLKELSEPNMVLMQKNRGHHPGDVRTFVFDDFIHVIDTILDQFPYPIESYHIRGRQKSDQLYHVVLQLGAKERVAIGIMNRDAGTTAERLEVMSTEETRIVTDVNEVASYKNKDIHMHGSNDWEPTLQRRGFYHIISTFIEKVRTDTVRLSDYEKDLERHWVAEKVVQELMKVQTHHSNTK